MAVASRGRDGMARSRAPSRGNVARFIDQGGREAAILSLLEAIETRYPMADPGGPVDVLDESLTGTDPYAAPAAGPAR